MKLGWVLAFAWASSALAAVESGAPVVFVDQVKKTELFETLTYPARVVPQVNTTILSEIDGIVRKIHSPLGQKIGRQGRLMTIVHTDPVYQYAPVAVTAPVAGIVSSVEVTEGSQVAKGQKLASVTDPSKVRIAVEIPAQDLSSVARGMEGELRLSGRDQKLTVRVRGVSPFVDPATGTASCELEAIPPKGQPVVQLAPGLLGQVSFKANSRQGISIPDYAVIYRGEETLVRLVGADGKAKQVPVKLGRKERGSVEVLNGLQADAQLVLRSSRYVADGETVKVEAQK
jgi:multidrug efflux pump subunit AcrA (membrane-fusion protein)